MAAVATAPGIPQSRLYWDSESLSTLRDPRSPSDGFPSPHDSAASSPHPDLNTEVATLSNKLISAINNQTHLDDALAATRQELESAQQRVRELQALNQEHHRLIVTGQLLRKEEVESQADHLNARLTEEKRQRVSVERDKKGIEQELENLTTALFEEANEMVAAARKEREVSDRRNDQLRNQLGETESLLASHQEQLSELKQVMAQMNRSKEDIDQTTNSSTAPSTPALPSQGEIDKSEEAIHVVSTGSLGDVNPAPPTSFQHLLSPVLRTDLTSYEDFRALLEIPRKSAPSSRVNSGSYGSVGIPGLSSSSAIPMHSSSHASQQSPTAQAAYNNAGSMPYSAAAIYTPLKETKFYKRALVEDIEPTMRLDAAPGLSWLARRSVISSMCDGTLVVEPMPASVKMSVFSCSLCGEHRQGEDFMRTHRFKTSESESAQRYPLCGYCLNRLRATCDYLGFLRMVKDGHWRTDGIEAEKLAWEESVRLRERMFWARIGGGVIPASLQRDPPRTSIDDYDGRTPFSASPVIYQTKENLNQENDGHGIEQAPDQWPKPQSRAVLQSNNLSEHIDQLRSSKEPNVCIDGATLSPSANGPSALSRNTHEPASSLPASNNTTRPQGEKSNSSHSTSSSGKLHQTSDGGLEINIPGGFEF